MQPQPLPRCGCGRGRGRGHGLAVAAARQRHASARDAVVDARLKMAQLLVAAGRAEHAAGHLRRILTLQPDHNGALSLLAEVGG